ncbi:MAG: Daunorubicin/doxorubicin resistance ATP-binding protein DrrA [Firmicutes bacterium ADurb.Bin080]|nr:MAG: Daunorubicin/doxorubicin resistance ATP-binding protein DrrA [Firmicutes bacterium ADurb.Bin080]
MGNIIEINNLVKYFGDIKAVDDISFTVERGSLFAFLGINGAGKSTTINILCTQLRKDSGRVIIDNIDLDKAPSTVKNRIGVVFQNSVLDPLLSVKDNLSIRASFYGLFGKSRDERIKELSSLLELDDLLKRPLGKLSGGQRRRVDIARGLIHYPEILFLDEPTTGLDAKTRKMIWNILNGIRKEKNMTVFLTTHYMEESEKANHVVIIDSGKIIANDTPNNLKKEYSGEYLRLYIEKSSETEEILSKLNFSYRYENECYTIRLKKGSEALELLNAYPKFSNDFEYFKGDMDDVFLNATGKKLEV